MIRKLAIIILSLATVVFMLLTVERMRMDYNENGIYFDGVVTYNADSILSYGVITGVLLLFTLGLIILRK
jgi:hypothetical protein